MNKSIPVVSATKDIVAGANSVQGGRDGSSTNGEK